MHKTPFTHLIATTNHYYPVQRSMLGTRLWDLMYVVQLPWRSHTTSGPTIAISHDKYDDDDDNNKLHP